MEQRRCTHAQLAHTFPDPLRQRLSQQPLTFHGRCAVIMDIRQTKRCRRLIHIPQHLPEERL